MNIVHKELKIIFIAQQSRKKTNMKWLLKECEGYIEAYSNGELLVTGKTLEEVLKKMSIKDNNVITWDYMMTEEKLEEKWNYIAHVYAVDADDEKDVERFKKARAGSWMVKSFDRSYNEYLAMKDLFNKQK